MSLAVYQETLKTLFMSEAGAEALQSKENLQQFLESCKLSDDVKALIINQPMDRLQQYGSMLFANVEETLSSIFPITQHMIGDGWNPLVRQFMWLHPPREHVLIGLGRPFPAFLKEQAGLMKTFPFLDELAQYEMTEAELLSAQDQNYSGEVYLDRIPEDVPTLSQWSPVLNHVARLCSFEYPITDVIDWIQGNMETDPTELTVQPQKTAVWIYRAESPYICRFFKVNWLLAYWLQSVWNLQEHQRFLTYLETLEPVARQVSESQPGMQAEAVYKEFLGILPKLVEKGILIGSLPKS